jgi:hypothetical protein
MIPPCNPEHEEAAGLAKALGDLVRKYHMRPTGVRRVVYPQENGDVLVRTVIISPLRCLTVDACLRLHDGSEDDRGF